MNKVITAAAGHPDISIIVSVYNEEESLGLFFETIRKTMERADGYTYEIICIDDGSTDGTYNLLEQYATEDFRVKVLKFSRNFGKEYGLMAGLKYCRGRAAVPIDVDLQDPPELILQFIQKWEEGYDMVYGIRNDRRSDSWLKRWTAKLFYKAYNLMTRSPIPYNAGDYRLIDRKIIDAILELKERNIFMKGIFDSVNSQVADVAGQVGQTPQGWNGGVFSMIQNLSETVVMEFCLGRHYCIDDAAAQNLDVSWIDAVFSGTAVCPLHYSQDDYVRR